MSIRHRGRERPGIGPCLMGALFIGFGMNAAAYNKQFPPAPAAKNVTISNGGLSITFNIAWGAAVIGIADENVDHGLDIVDRNDVGRDLQPCQFLLLTIGGRQQIILNPPKRERRDISRSIDIRREWLSGKSAAPS